MKKMTLEEAKEIMKFQKHCADNCLAGCLYIYSKLFRKARKVIKKEEKKK